MEHVLTENGYCFFYRNGRVFELVFSFLAFATFIKSWQHVK